MIFSLRYKLSISIPQTSFIKKTTAICLTVKFKLGKLSLKCNCTNLSKKIIDEFYSNKCAKFINLIYINGNTNIYKDDLFTQLSVFYLFEVIFFYNK